MSLILWSSICDLVSSLSRNDFKSVSPRLITMKRWLNLSKFTDNISGFCLTNSTLLPNSKIGDKKGFSTFIPDMFVEILEAYLLDTSSFVCTTSSGRMISNSCVVWELEMADYSVSFFKMFISLKVRLA